MNLNIEVLPTKGRFGMSNSSSIPGTSKAGGSVQLSDPDPHEVVLELRAGAGTLPEEHKRIRLVGNMVTVGRAMTHSIVLSCLQISRNHCTFVNLNGVWHVSDQSTNGIFVNESRVGRKEQRRLVDGDILHLIPNGILNYRVRYKHAPSTSRAKPSAPHPEPEIVIDEDSSASESLLSIENSDDVEEMYVTCTEHPPMNLKTKISPAGPTFIDCVDKTSPPKTTNFSASTISKCGWQKRAFCGTTTTKPVSKPKKCRKAFAFLSSDSSDSDIEELPDVDEPTRPNAFLNNFCSNAQKPSYQLSSSSPEEKKQPEKLSEQNVEEETGYKNQIRVLTEKCKELQDTQKLIILQNKMDVDKLKKELNDLKSKSQIDQELLYKSIIDILENEFNCCICNEVFISATVIDCAHTYCNHCITEWCKKKSECPTCRSAVRKRVKHTEMENFISRLYTALPPEIQAKREAAIKEREDEIVTCQVHADAEAEATRQRIAAGGPRFAFTFDPQSGISHLPGGPPANPLFDLLADMGQLNANIGDFMGDLPFPLQSRRGRGRPAAGTNRRSQRIGRRNVTPAAPAPAAP